MRKSRQIAMMEGVKLPPRSTNGFKAMAAGFILSFGAFIAGVFWNVTDKFPDEKLVQDCNEDSLTPEFTIALIEGKENGTIVVPKSKNSITLVHEGDERIETSFDRIKACNRVHELERKWRANHPSRKAILAGGISSLIFGTTANSMDSTHKRNVGRQTLSR